MGENKLVWVVANSSFINDIGKNKKPNYLNSRQLGYLLRPVAFRACITAGSALSCIDKTEFCLIFILCIVLAESQENNI